MKISYTFANGENSEVEVNEEIGTFILDSRREEDNLGRKERYHCYSLNAAEFEGEDMADCETPEMAMMGQFDREHIAEALGSLSEVQQRRILMLAQGLSVREIARREGKEIKTIKYTAGSNFTCSNLAEAKVVAKRTYEAAVELFAYLCKKYRLNPLADSVIISHREGHSRGIASNHGDPEHLWTQLGTGYTMMNVPVIPAAGFKSYISNKHGCVLWVSQRLQITVSDKILTIGCVWLSLPKEAAMLFLFPIVRINLLCHTKCRPRIRPAGIECQMCQNFSHFCACNTVFTCCRKVIGQRTVNNSFTDKGCKCYD